MNSDKQIRFIDSHYNDLFRLPDGEYIKITSHGEEKSEQCKFIDEYHTMIGNTVFHICQFAEVMEMNGSAYQPEPEITVDEAAWKTGRNQILTIQSCDDGYDYNIFDSDFNLIDGGQLDNTDLSLREARNEIIESLNLSFQVLKPVDYDEVMEKAQLKSEEKSMTQTDFLENSRDEYGIFQLKRNEDTVMERFESLDSLHRKGKEPQFDHYELVYADKLMPYINLNTMLDSLYSKFNLSRHDNFTGHSMSVSDVIAIKKDGNISCYYVDSIGFKELPDFIKPENYLKNAEVSLEDDYNMIDGIINNGSKEEKPSVLEKLNEKPLKKSLPKKTKEPER